MPTAARPARTPSPPPGTLTRAAFFERLGISQGTFRTWRQAGLLPDPPRLPGSRIILWTADYLATCQKIVREIRAAERTVRSPAGRRRLLDLHRKGKL